jgi:hypothetical protein
MDGSFLIIGITVVIHFIGIGLFLAWLVLGKPTSWADWQSRRAKRKRGSR